MPPFFTVVIPTRQRHDTLLHAMRTVLSQDHDSFELVVMDNKSSVETVDTVFSFGDRRVKYVRAHERLAMSDNWELGLAHATGQYTFFLGDDDGLMPRAFAQAEALIRQHDAKLLAWDRPTYWWGNALATWCRNRIAVNLGDRVQAMDSMTVVKAFYQYKFPFSTLPMLYNAFVHKDVIAAVSARYHRYFMDPIPDIFSGIINAYATDAYLLSWRGLSLAGVSGHSTGASYSHQGRDAQSATLFQAENKKSKIDAPLHPDLVESTHPDILIANTMLRTKALYFPEDAEVQHDVGKLILRMAAMINHDPTTYDLTADTILRLAGKYGLPLTAAELPKKLEGEYEPPEGLMERTLWINAEKLGVTNVYDATVALDQILEGRTEAPVPATPVSISSAAPRQEVPVRWEGPLFEMHSLGHVNREFCRRLSADGRLKLEVRLPALANAADAHESRNIALAPLTRPLDAPAAVVVRHQWPPDFKAPTTGAWVMMQPWEFGGLPAEWVATLRDQVDEFWVYTHWLKDCAVKSGVPESKVHVVPCGVDAALYTPEGPRFPLKTQKRFKFLFVGGLINRKGIEVLVNTYFQTFTIDDDVCLVIKGSGVNTFYEDGGLAQKIQAMRAEFRHFPEVEYLDADLTDAEVASLYRACDALAHPYRGEGFGLPIAEAMACGLPVVVTNYGACLDFCDAQSAYLVEADVVPMPRAHELPPPSIGYWWAEPRPASLSQALRAVVADPAAAREVGRRGRERIVKEFSWDRAAATAQARILALAGREPLRFQPAGRQGG